MDQAEARLHSLYPDAILFTPQVIDALIEARLEKAGLLAFTALMADGSYQRSTYIFDVSTPEASILRQIQAQVEQNILPVDSLQRATLAIAHGDFLET